ncbi:hypothetical protein FBU30_003340 [Linnemannia zychae]|nr:hypothetical protein FBU30_003340 [Linnemannia zychae]
MNSRKTCYQGFNASRQEQNVQDFRLRDDPWTRYCLHAERNSSVDNFTTVLEETALNNLPSYHDIEHPDQPGQSWPILPNPPRRQTASKTLEVIRFPPQDKGALGSIEDNPHRRSDPPEFGDQQGPEDPQGGNSGGRGYSDSGLVGDNGMPFVEVASYEMTLRLNEALRVRPLMWLPVRLTRLWKGAFSIIPMYQQSSGSIDFLSEQTWKVFHICVPECEEWDPHLIKEHSHVLLTGEMASHITSLFGSILVSTTQLLLDALRKGKSTPSANPTQMSDYNHEIDYLYNELNLESNSQDEKNDQVEDYLERTIDAIEKRIASTIKSMSNRPPSSIQLTKSDMEILSFCLNGSPADMDIAQEKESGCYLAPGRLGCVQVCFNHHAFLYPDSIERYVGEQTASKAVYDSRTGRLRSDITSAVELDTFCRLDQTKIGFVAEFDVVLQESDEWKPSTEEVKQLHEFAAGLGIDYMTITDGDRNSANDAANRTIADEMSLVGGLLTRTISGFKRVDVVWNSDLDAATLINEVAELGTQYLSLSIKTINQEVLGEIRNGELSVPYVKTLDLSSISGTSVLAGKIQNLKVSSAPSKELLHENTSLTSLTLTCPATNPGFKRPFKEIQDIIRPLNDTMEIQRMRLPFRYLFLTNNTNNDLTAAFDLSKQSTVPLALDVTVEESSIPTPLIKSYGEAVRVLNIIGSSNDAYNILKELCEPKKLPKGLVTLTILLEKLTETHVGYLAKILESSKETFAQLALLSQPKDNGVKEKLIALLEKLERCQVLLTQTEQAGISSWITEATPAIVKSNVLVIVKSAAELIVRVPGFSDERIPLLEEVFLRTEPILTELSGPQVIRSQLKPKEHS